MINVLDYVDLVPSNVQSSHQEALLYIFEDNEAVINMIIEKLPFPQNLRISSWSYDMEGSCKEVCGAIL